MQISVCSSITRYNGTNQRQYVPEIKLESLSKNGDNRLGEFKKDDRTSGFQNTPDFVEAAIPVLEVSQTEGHGNSIEAGIREGQFQSVRLNNTNAARSFFGSADQHGMAKIRSDDVRLQGSTQRNRKIS